MGHASGVRGVQAGEPGSPDPAGAVRLLYILPQQPHHPQGGVPGPARRELRQQGDRRSRARTNCTGCSTSTRTRCPNRYGPRRLSRSRAASRSPTSPPSRIANSTRTRRSRTEAERKIALQYLAPTGAANGREDRPADGRPGGRGRAPHRRRWAAAAGWAGLAWRPPDAGPRIPQPVQPRHRSGPPRRATSGSIRSRTRPRSCTTRPPAGPPRPPPCFGRALGGSLTQAGPLTTPVGAVADSALDEANDRIRLAAAAWVLGAGGGSALSGAVLAAPPVPIALSAAALAVPSLPARRRPPPLRIRCSANFSSRTAPELALENLNKFIDELTKLKGRPEEAQHTSKRRSRSSVSSITRWIGRKTCTN